MGQIQFEIKQEHLVRVSLWAVTSGCWPSSPPVMLLGQQDQLLSLEMGITRCPVHK